MNQAGPSHSDAGLKRLLAQPWVYSVFSRVLARRTPGWLVCDHVKPYPGCRILDLGCGPGDQVQYLADSIAEYVGVDMSADYIDAARRQYGQRPGFTFVCADLASYAAPQSNHFDIVMAVGLIHHLDDAAVRRVVTLAHEALAPGGRLITFDGVYIDRQPAIAKWLLERDRGRAVRTAEGYRRLTCPPFERGVDAILHDTLRLPYTTFVMTLTKT